MKRKFDPILVEVIKNELATVNEEMAIAVYRTGRSAMVKVGDFATAVADAQGRIEGEGAAPFQIGIFMAMLESLIGKFGRSLKAGDVILVNDPTPGWAICPTSRWSRPPSGAMSSSALRSPIRITPTSADVFPAASAAIVLPLSRKDCACRCLNSTTPECAMTGSSK